MRKDLDPTDSFANWNCECGKQCCALQDYPEVTEMVTTFEIYLREKYVAENCQHDSNQRKAHTQVCDNFQGVVVCLCDINTKKPKDVRVANSQ